MLPIIDVSNCKTPAEFIKALCIGVKQLDEQCDYCRATEAEIRQHYELAEDEELRWYYLGPEGEITICEMCHGNLH